MQEILAYQIIDNTKEEDAMDEKLNADLKKALLTKNVIIAILLIILVIICSAIITILTRVSTSNEIPVSNLSNLGLVVQDGEYVYYNKYNNGIFKSKGSEETQITEEPAYSIQINDNQLYYLAVSSEHNICIKKTDLNGENTTLVKLISTSINKFFIQDDFLYYASNMSNSGIVKLDLKSKAEQNIVNANIKDFELLDNTIYYTDDLGYLYSLEVNSLDRKTIFAGANITEFQVYKGKVFYYDAKENALMVGKIVENSTPTKLSSEVNSAYFNVYNNKIYFYNPSEKYIKSSTIDGKLVRQIISINANSTRINITQDGKLYYLDTPKSGKTNFELHRILENGLKTKDIEY